MALTVWTAAARPAGPALTATKSALSLTLTGLTVSVTSAMTTATMALAVVAIGIELSATGAECEVGSLALWNVPFGSWQLRANQRTMDRPLIAFITFGGDFTIIDRHRLRLRLRRRFLWRRCEFDVLLFTSLYP